MAIVNSLPNGLSTPFPAEDSLRNQLESKPWTVDFLLRMSVAPWAIESNHPALTSSAIWEAAQPQESVNFTPYVRIKRTQKEEMAEVLDRLQVSLTEISFGLLELRADVKPRTSTQSRHTR